MYNIYIYIYIYIYIVKLPVTGLWTRQIAPVTHTHTHTHTHTLSAVWWRHFDPLTLTAFVTSGGVPTVPNDMDKMSADSREFLKEESDSKCAVRQQTVTTTVATGLRFFTLVVAMLLLCFSFTTCDTGSCATLRLDVMSASSGSGECCYNW